MTYGRHKNPPRKVIKMENENLTLSECQIDFFNNKTKIDERCVQWLCQKTNYTFAVEFISDEEMALADDSIKSSIINGCIDNNCPYLYSNESSNPQ